MFKYSVLTYYRIIYNYNVKISLCKNLCLEKNAHHVICKGKQGIFNHKLFTYTVTYLSYILYKLFTNIIKL